MRFIGIAVIALVLIAVDGYRGYRGVNNLLVEPELKQIDAMLFGKGTRPISNKEADQLHARRDFLTSPMVRCQRMLLALLHVAGFVAGVGLLFLEAWARELAILQRVLMVGARIWMAEWARRVGFGPASWEAMIQPLAPVVLGSVFVVWFLLRPSVREQFLAQTTTSESE